jgi:hypothetical protein
MKGPCKLVRLAGFGCWLENEYSITFNKRRHASLSVVLLLLSLLSLLNILLSSRPGILELESTSEQ